MRISAHGRNGSAINCVLETEVVIVFMLPHDLEKNLLVSGVEDMVYRIGKQKNEMWIG